MKPKFHPVAFRAFSDAHYALSVLAVFCPPDMINCVNAAINCLKDGYDEFISPSEDEKKDTTPAK